MARPISLNVKQIGSEKRKRLASSPSDSSDEEAPHTQADYQTGKCVSALEVTEGHLLKEIFWPGLDLVQLSFGPMSGSSWRVCVNISVLQEPAL